MKTVFILGWFVVTTFVVLWAGEQCRFTHPMGHEYYCAINPQDGENC